MDDDLSFFHNAIASFEELTLSGDPASPLPFPRAITGRAERVNGTIYHPATGTCIKITNYNIIFQQQQPQSNAAAAPQTPPDRAYWVGRTLRQCIYGMVKHCTIVHFQPETGVWEVTPEEAAVKIMSWQRIRDLKHVEDPQKEVAALQYISRRGQHSHVMGALDVLEDDEYLLLFMRLCSSGDLYSLLEQAGNFSESMARYWFRQILEGLSHLQRMGVCHRDLSLENILLDDSQKSVIIDLGMCLRVPFQSNGNSSSHAVCDVTAGTLRRLILPQEPCGKPFYISPEVLQSSEPFDGFAIDLWAAAVVLFIMLVGVPPWDMAHEDDARYRIIAVSGRLEDLLRRWKRPISVPAAHLLQCMLRQDPRQRLTLHELMQHEWLVHEEPTIPVPEPLPLPSHRESWRL